MKRQDLYEAIGQTDDDILERSEQNKRANRRGAPRWIGVVAAVLVIAIGGISILHPGNGAIITSAYAVEQASYPEMAPYPSERAWDFSEQLDAWHASKDAQRERGRFDKKGLEQFFAASIPQFLSGDDGENRVYSPVNVYMALSMLAEMTDGESRQQILDLLGADNMEALRAQAKGVWNAHYCKDGETTSVLANSIWLNQDVPFVSETMKTLAENYYVSSYQGEMGKAPFNKELRRWLNEQTDGLIKEQVHDIALKQDDALALASTIYFRAKWGGTARFSKKNTKPAVFHALDGDITCDFMHGSDAGEYYWAEHFAALRQNLQNDGGSMWYLLPDEGVSAEELLTDPQTMEFLWANGAWENQKHLMVNRAIPKFDISAGIDLQQGLQSMGVTDVFDPVASDFSPMIAGKTEAYISQAQHDVRVQINEEGVAAAAYVVMAGAGSSAPPDDEVDFVLDRPFLFAIVSDAGLPLFVGVVNQPNA